MNGHLPGCDGPCAAATIPGEGCEADLPLIYDYETGNVYRYENRVHWHNYVTREHAHVTATDDVEAELIASEWAGFFARQDRESGS